MEHVREDDGEVLGEIVEQGDSVSLAYAMYDAKTGKKLDSRGWSAKSRVVFPVDAAQVLHATTLHLSSRRWRGCR